MPPPPAHRYVLIDSSYRPHRSHSGLPPNDRDDNDQHNHNHDNLAVVVIVVSGRSSLGHIQARSIYLASMARTSIDVAAFVREVQWAKKPFQCLTNLTCGHTNAPTAQCDDRFHTSSRPHGTPSCASRRQSSAGGKQCAQHQQGLSQNARRGEPEFESSWR